MVSIAVAHSPEPDEKKSTRDIVYFRDSALLSTMMMKEAVILLDKSKAEALAVVKAIDDRKVIGLFTESYALRRYSEELKQRRQDLLGERSD